METIGVVSKYRLFSQAENERFDKEFTEKEKKYRNVLSAKNKQLDSLCPLFILQIQILFVIFTTLDSRYALVLNLTDSLSWTASLSKTFLTDARQPEMDLLNFWPMHVPKCSARSPL